MTKEERDAIANEIRRKTEKIRLFDKFNKDINTLIELKTGIDNESIKRLFGFDVTSMFCEDKIPRYNSITEEIKSSVLNIIDLKIEKIKEDIDKL